MALFKILRGKSSAFTTDLQAIEISPEFHDGYCYFVADTGLFYIDYDEKIDPVFHQFTGADVGYRLTDGKAYYLADSSAEDGYSLYRGNYNLLSEYKDNLENMPYFYYKTDGRRRIPLNAAQVMAVKEINKGLDQKFWRGTKAEYDAIEEKDDSVLYLVTDQFEVIESTYMDQATYDPQKKKTDIFQYAENTHKTAKAGLILTDLINNKNYVIQMINGNLVSRPCIASLRIKTPPLKINYALNELFDPTGMVVEAIYEDETVEEIDFYDYDKVVTDFDFVIYYNQAGNIIQTTLELVQN